MDEVWQPQLVRCARGGRGTRGLACASPRHRTRSIPSVCRCRPRGCSRESTTSPCLRTRREGVSALPAEHVTLMPMARLHVACEREGRRRKRARWGANNRRSNHHAARYARAQLAAAPRRAAQESAHCRHKAL
eukprot:5904920-Pleurochrysis_carterae.AAC.1